MITNAERKSVVLIPSSKLLASVSEYRDQQLGPSSQILSMQATVSRLVKGAKDFYGINTLNPPSMAKVLQLMNI